MKCGGAFCLALELLVRHYGTILEQLYITCLMPVLRTFPMPLLPVAGGVKERRGE